jgi:hypothetical protein
MENPALIRVSLSDARVTIVIMCVLMLKLLYQTVMGQVPVLECLLSRVQGATGYILSCLTLNDLASRGPRLSSHLPGT